ncbi:hypothetical protein FBU59_000361 [Linderina macrospora]|uniref:Uncharacterized protein n=1 Tax=Linderina macrospora TaxID=4868 RepID=A0ACC1JHA0_9FUNG|nr:hypothetical protein FBU59_000361 [Linderina macrospora]
MSHSRTNPDQSTKPPEDLEIEATPIVQAAICKNDSTESTGTEASSAAGASTESASSKATSEGLAVEEPELVAVAAGIQAVVVKQDDAPPPPPVVEEGGEVEGGVVDAENSGFDQSHHHYDSITFSYAALKSTVPDDPVVVESTSATAAAAVVVEKEDEEEQEENMPQQQPLLSSSEDVSVTGGGNDDQHEVVDETGGHAMDSSAVEDAESSSECTPVGEQCADENEAGEVLPGKGSADGIVDEEKNALGDAEPAVSVKDEEAVCASSSDEDLLLCSSSVSDQTSSVLADFNMFNFGSTPSMTVDPNTPLFTIPIATTAVAADIPAPEPAQQTEQTDQAEDNERSVLANVVSPPPHATDKTG